jgi:hypothetical protein
MRKSRSGVHRAAHMGSKAILHARRQPKGLRKKAPPFATGAKSREVTALRRHHNPRPIRYLEGVPQLTQWQ